MVREDSRCGFAGGGDLIVVTVEEEVNPITSSGREELRRSVGPVSVLFVDASFDVFRLHRPLAEAARTEIVDPPSSPDLNSTLPMYANVSG